MKDKEQLDEDLVLVLVLLLLLIVGQMFMQCRRRWVRYLNLIEWMESEQNFLTHQRWLTMRVNDTSFWSHGTDMMNVNIARACPWVDLVQENQQWQRTPE